MEYSKCEINITYCDGRREERDLEEKKKELFYITLKSRQTKFFLGTRESEFATFLQVESVDVKTGLKDDSILCPWAEVTQKQV